MSRAKFALLAAALAVAAVAAFFGFRIHAELARGQQIFWLAELWPPAAVLTVILVVCIDVFVPPSPSGSAGRPKARPRPAA